MDNRRLLELLTSYSHRHEVSLNSQVTTALARMNMCRTQDLGGRVLVCPECGTRIVQYNPCNKRGCPICYRKNQIQWQAKAEKRILPTTHYHIAFSIPDRYTLLWLTKKAQITECLFQAVKAALRSIGDNEGLLLGSMLAFQSHGAGLSYKPHIHCLLSDGGLDKSGNYRVLRSVPTKRMEEIVRTEFEDGIRNELAINTESVAELNRSDQYRTHIEIHAENGNAVIGYLAKTRNGVVVDVEDGIEEVGNDICIREKGQEGVRETRLSIETFLERYLNHIPPERLIVTRYYGLYSNRHKEDFRKAGKQIKAKAESEVEEVFKELCPVCNCEVRIALLFKKEELHLALEICNKQGPPIHGEIIRIA